MTTLRGAFCVWALAAGSAAFVPSSISVATTGSRANNGPVAMNIATDSTSAVGADATPSVLRDFDHHSSDRLPYSPTGYSTWEWKTHQGALEQANGESESESESTTTTHSVNYLEVGDPTKPALLLVHGFGASSYHFRHNVPVLAREYHVYALDLLGFGWSDKPVMDYDASVWRDQVVDFAREVVLGGGDDASRPIAIAGNSLGGYAAMYAASDERIRENVKGCVLLNAAGRFRDPEADDEAPASAPNPIVEAVSAALQRFVIACSFVYTKRPSRIEQVLRQVYPVDDSNVDEELVESIYTPALGDTAAEVFYRVINKNGSGPQAYVDDILEKLECPVLLAWGESDPWIRSAAADKMERLHAEFHGEEKGSRWIRRASIDAGHCPHDEAPEAVNGAILGFADEVFGVA